MAEQKHLTLEDRIIIESMLTEKCSLSAIADEIGKSLSTVSREVRRGNISVKSGSSVGHAAFNNCKKRYDCSIRKLCSPCLKSVGTRLCRSCNLCTLHCEKYEKEECRRLSKPPYVCNGCGLIGYCTLEKKKYIAKNADERYRKVLSEARIGVNYTEEELAYLDSLITPLVKKGQSPHHICITNNDLLPVSESTIYRLIDSQLISAKNIDLPRKVRFRPRKKKVMKKVDKRCRIGRTYVDFLNYLSEHPDTPIVQIDTVEGIKGEACLLTIHFVKAEMMLAFLRGHNTSDSVTEIFNILFEGLGPDEFRALFPLILTDNGTEFSNPEAIEFDAEGKRRCHLFYCDPQASGQKGSAERNHEFIRMFISKGKDFGIYTQAHITYMMNHINSYSRESLGNRCPYDVFEFLYGTKLIDLVGGFKIPPDKVTLNKSVFKEVDV